MKVEITGNPGTGNTFQEIHIGKVENYNPAATTVNNYYGARKEPGPLKEDASPEEVASKTEAVLTYIRPLQQYATQDWAGRHQRLWEEILKAQSVASEICQTGKQHGAVFNRNLVANIVHYLGRCGIYQPPYNASLFATLIEKDWTESVRQQLGKDPNESIMRRIDKVIENQTL